MTTPLPLKLDSFEFDALVRFLQARVAEDEENAYRIHDLLDDKYTWPDDLLGCPCGVPARVLADCSAKRRIINHALGARGVWAENRADKAAQAVARTAESILGALALIYREHPDFTMAWVC